MTSGSSRGQEHVATERDALDGALDATLGADHDGVRRRPIDRAVLVVRHEGASRVVELGEGTELAIGRLEGADVSIQHPSVSRRHAVVRVAGGVVSIEDLGTANGTKVNRVALARPQRLVAGDVIHVGPAEILVALSWSREPARAEANPVDVPDDLIVADPAMVKVFSLAKRLAATLTTVLLTGETGSGKEVIADQLHAWSSRRDGPFVRLNCGSLPDTLLENELFGHEKGAFTGATQRKVGYFEAAQDGTLLLDEIGELGLGLQAKLLRALESRKIARLGETAEIAINARVVLATHRDLKALVEKGLFREDLYYRLSTFTLRVPPLRERQGEILPLAERFARHFAEVLGVPVPALDEAFSSALRTHAWPGNVRELRNAIEHALVLAEGATTLRVEHLPEALAGARAGAPRRSTAMRGRLEEIEKKTIAEALLADEGNRTRAAGRLGMSRRALLYKIAKYGLR
jgi:two-component system, NtrC family, response regulator AtoC